MVVTLGQQYNVGEKPTVILDTYVIRHIIMQGHQTKTKHKQSSTSLNRVVVIIYDVLVPSNHTTNYRNIMIL